MRGTFSLGQYPCNLGSDYGSNSRFGKVVSVDPPGGVLGLFEVNMWFERDIKGADVRLYFLKGKGGMRGTIERAEGLVPFHDCWVRLAVLR